jgi:hypothetical protein
MKSIVNRLFQYNVDPWIFGRHLNTSLANDIF